MRSEGVPHPVSGPYRKHPDELSYGGRSVVADTKSRREKTNDQTRDSGLHFVYVGMDGRTDE